MTRVLCSLLSLALVLPGPLTAAAGPVPLPDLGDASSAIISPAQERRLGEDFMRKARQALPFLDDPEVDTYLQTLGQRLVARSDNPQQDFRFFVIADPAVNAFAVPGGFVGVHTGLVLATQGEGELASVLAHEIAHVTQRHYPRMIAEAERTNLPAMAALLAAVLLAGSGHQGGEAAIALTTATMAQKGLNFTRAAEEEADRIGIGLLAASDFDPRAMPAFFERLQTLNRHNETNLPEFLRTHPVTTARITDSRDRAERHRYRQVPDSSEFLHVRAKLRALAPGDPNEAVRGFEYNLQQGKYTNIDAERYGYALALLRTRQYDAARAQMQKLLERHPADMMYRLGLAEIELGAGRYTSALAAYEATYKKNASYYPLQRRYAQALLKGNRAPQAMQVLRSAIKQRPDDPALYELLAQAAGAAGKRTEAHQAMAEHYYWNGNPKAAIEQLQLAGRFAGDNFYVQASVEARMQAIKDEIALYRGKP